MIHPIHKKANELWEAIQDAGKAYTNGVFRLSDEGEKTGKDTTWLKEQVDVLLEQMKNTIKPLQEEYDKLFNKR